MKPNQTKISHLLLCVALGLLSACSEGPKPQERPVVPAAESSIEAPAVPPEEGPLVEAEDPFEEFEVEKEDEAAPPSPVHAGTEILIDPAARIPKFLSEFNLFADPVKQVPNPGLVPYTLNTGHFSDGADVARFIRIPPGSHATYDPTGVFTFPIGTALFQTFSYPQQEDSPGAQRIETRLLLKQADETWTLSSYKWDESGTDAKKAVAGNLVPVAYTDGADEAHSFDYLIPNKNDCKRCHERAEEVLPIGLTARNLNRAIDYGSGMVNQLTHWIETGLLQGAPEDPHALPNGPEWDNPDTGTVTERARMWLDVNCAHCHNPTGAGAVSGLDLSITQESPIRFGVYKPPVAAGRSSEGLRFSIDPGHPDTSFLIRRLLSTDPSVMMPPLGRMTANKEAATLVAEWIATLKFDEADAQHMIAEQEKAFKLLQEQAAAEAAKAGVAAE